MPKGAVSSDAPIIHVLYQLYSSLNILLNKFPKSHRYTLGTNCQQQLLATIEAVVTAANSSDKATKVIELRRASTKLDILRLMIRLSKDCKCITNANYLQLESTLHEAGRMLGGWIKSLPS